MTDIRLTLAAVLVAALAAPGFTQLTNKLAEPIVPLNPARDADERAEDVEVLRRLLNRSLGLENSAAILPDAPTSWQMGPSSTGVNDALASARGMAKLDPSGGVVSGAHRGKRVSAEVGPFDGVFLKGTGVVFTLHVPAGADLAFDPAARLLGVTSSCGQCHTAAAVGAVHETTQAKVQACSTCHSDISTPVNPVRPLTDWERAKMDLRGEKPTDVAAPVKPKADRPAVCKPGELAELLTAALFQNAKNVRHLDAGERITVVVTFDALPTAAAKTVEPVGKGGFTPDEIQSLTLGDLHMKQQKYAEAAAAYEKALARYAGPVVRLTFPSTMSPKDAEDATNETRKSVSGIYRSLAAALLQAGETDRAKAALEKATTLKTETTLGGVAAGKAKPQLPAKLIVGASKAELDKAADLAAFRKAVSVERANFPAK